MTETKQSYNMHINKEYPMNRYLKIFLMFAVVALVFTATDASAQNVFSQILSKLLNTFKNVRSVIFVVGGFGLVGLGFAAIFGKIKWPWLAALACGLAVVALAGAMVDYVTDSDEGGGGVVDYDANWEDTLSN